MAPLIDPLWSAVHIATEKTPTQIAALLQDVSAIDFRSAVNPLIDLKFIAESYFDNGTKLSALDVLVRYACELMPRGRSPHPLIDKRVFEGCLRRTVPGRRSLDHAIWVQLLLNTRGHSKQGIIPVLDPAFVLKQAKIEAADLTALGARSVGHFYLGDGARKGLLPHPLFDPVFVHAQRTGHLPSSSELADPGEFLVTELGGYLRQAGRQGRASPSLGFDEILVRGKRPFAEAIERCQYINAFHAFVAHQKRLRILGTTRSGIHMFPEAIRPRIWWRLDDPVLRYGARLGSPNAVFTAAARRRLLNQSQLPAHVNVDGDWPGTVILGQRLTLVVHGYAITPFGRLGYVEVRVGRRSASGSFQGFPRADVAPKADEFFARADPMFCGFAASWCGDANRVGPLKVSIRFRSARDSKSWTRWFEAGTLKVEGPVPRIRTGPKALVAIAMATYNPNPKLFRAQIESIRSQSVSDWRLIVCDDCSDDDHIAQIRRSVEGDPRIQVIQGERLGFVGNFERALGRLDRRSPYFAVSDQDDVWYPNKLARLVEAIERDGTALVYGGMRIASDTGAVLDDSFFSWRQRHSDTSLELLLANTVTGAACLAKMELMRQILPIPRYTSVFHDMWIALIASKNGGITFVEGPLQDYVQHSANTLGHSSAADKRAARTIAGHRRSFIASISDTMNGNTDGHRSATLQSKLPELLAIHKVEIIQRMFLDISLMYRESGMTRRDPLSIKSLRRAALCWLSQIKDGNEARRFLNLPSYLYAGIVCLDYVRSKAGMFADKDTIRGGQLK